MSRPRSAPFAVAIVAAVAAVVGADRLLPAQSPRPTVLAAAETRPLTSSTLVCPELPGATAARTTEVALTTEATTGTVTARWLGGTSADTVVPATAGRSVLPLPPGSFGGVVLTAAGDAAAGFSAVTTTLYDADTTVGTASVPCLAPLADAYLVGPATTAGHDPRLVLVNPDPTPANVDVSIAKDGSPFSPDNTRGFALPGFGTAAVALADLAPDQAAVAVHVQTRSGRVTAAVRDRWFSGALPQGIDWLTAGAAPGTDLLLPGVGGAGTTVSLALASQSTGAGTVVVHAITASGEFTPAGLEDIALPAGAIVRVAVPKSAFGALGTLHITSDVPLIAAAVTTRLDAPSSPPRPDFAWTPAAVPLAGPSYAAPGTQLVLTTASDTGVVLRSGGLAVTLTVPAGRTVVVPANLYPDGVLIVPAQPDVLSVTRVDAPDGRGGALTAAPLTTPRRTAVLLPARPDIFLGAR